MKELNHFKEIQSPHVVNILMASKDYQKYRIVMEYMPGASLKDFIHKHGKLDEIQAQY